MKNYNFINLLFCFCITTFITYINYGADANPKININDDSLPSNIETINGSADWKYLHSKHISESGVEVYTFADGSREMHSPLGIRAIKFQNGISKVYLPFGMRIYITDNIKLISYSNDYMLITKTMCDSIHYIRNGKIKFQSAVPGIMKQSCTPKQFWMFSAEDRITGYIPQSQGLLTELSCDLIPAPLGLKSEISTPLLTIKNTSKEIIIHNNNLKRIIIQKELEGNDLEWHFIDGSNPHKIKYSEICELLNLNLSEEEIAAHSVPDKHFNNLILNRAVIPNLGIVVSYKDGSKELFSVEGLRCFYSEQGNEIIHPFGKSELLFDGINLSLAKAFGWHKDGQSITICPHHQIKRGRRGAGGTIELEEVHYPAGMISTYPNLENKSLEISTQGFKGVSLKKSLQKVSTVYDTDGIAISTPEVLYGERYIHFEDYTCHCKNSTRTITTKPGATIMQEHIGNEKKIRIKQGSAYYRSALSYTSADIQRILFLDIASILNSNGSTEEIIEDQNIISRTANKSTKRTSDCLYSTDEDVSDEIQGDKNTTPKTASKRVRWSR